MAPKATNVLVSPWRTAVELSKISAPIGRGRLFTDPAPPPVSPSASSRGMAPSPSAHNPAPAAHAGSLRGCTGGLVEAGLRRCTLCTPTAARRVAVSRPESTPPTSTVSPTSQHACPWPPTGSFHSTPNDCLLAKMHGSAVFDQLARCPAVRIVTSSAHSPWGSTLRPTRPASAMRASSVVARPCDLGFRAL